MERRFLEWAVVRSDHDVGFASDLEFVPTGKIDNQQRLREHLLSRQPSKAARNESARQFASWRM